MRVIAREKERKRKRERERGAGIQGDIEISEVVQTEQGRVGQDRTGQSYY